MAGFVEGFHAIGGLGKAKFGWDVEQAGSCFDDFLEFFWGEMLELGENFGFIHGRAVDRCC
jgi:hypothetical protein